jgi:hypothetical protein
MMRPLNRNSLQLTVPLVTHVQIHPQYLISSQEQCPPPLVVALKPHELVNKTELVSNVIVVYLVVVAVAEVPTKEVEVNSLLQGRTPNFLCHRHPGHALTAEQDHVERLLVIAGCHDQVQRQATTPEDGCLDSTPCRLGSLSHLLFLKHARWATPSALPQHSINLDLLGARIHSSGKLH